MPLPVEFTNKMRSLLGAEYENFIKCFDDERYYGLRVNTLKISVEDFLRISPFKLEKIPWVQEGFYYSREDRPSKHPYYHAGLYYIQEPSAMAPADVIGVKPGNRVLDLCAAPGGKSTQLAAKLAGEGLLVSNDISNNRIKALVKNIELYGVKNSVITNESPERLSKRFEDYFDKIVVDAPCSGEGMFRKDENAAKSWGVHSVEKCCIMQKSILHEAAKMVKPGGYILYSTCTFSPEENEWSISNFLECNKNFELVEIPKHSGIEGGRREWTQGGFEVEKCARFWPHKVKGEGHFLALLRKIDGNEKKQEISGKIFDKKLITDYNKFSDEYLKEKIEGEFELYGDYLYLSPKGIPSLNGLKVIRPGWFLGILKKGRFEPSQAFVMGLKSEQIKNIVNFSNNSSEVLRYLKGETLEIKVSKGWNAVCVDGFTLGWAKGQEDILKNDYPAGWRWIEN